MVAAHLLFVCDWCFGFSCVFVLLLFVLWFLIWLTFVACSACCLVLLVRWFVLYCWFDLGDLVVFGGLSDCVAGVGWLCLLVRLVYCCGACAFGLVVLGGWTHALRY